MRGFWIAVLCLGWAADVQAQRIIYDGKRDTTAQQAAAVAKEVTAGALFDTMLRNVDAQAKLEVDTVTAFVQERMRAKLNALDVWFDAAAQPAIAGPSFSPMAAAACERAVECVLRTLRQRHLAALSAPAITPEELEKRLGQIKAKQTALRAELKALEASQPPDPFVIRAFAALEDPGGDALDHAQKIVDFATKNAGLSKGVGQALDAVESGLDQVLALYKAIAGIWKGQQAVSVDPASLRPPPQQLDLQLLAVEQGHLRTRARIDARRHLEVGAALASVEEALGLLESTGLARSTEAIEASLRTAATSHDRRRLHDLMTVLHETAASLAQLDSAASLAELRLSDEERRYSIRRSAVNASTYDTTIQAAVQRLALYWKGGIKPGEIAQFAFYIANTFAIPVIAFKQE